MNVVGNKLGKLNHLHQQFILTLQSHYMGIDCYHPMTGRFFSRPIQFQEEQTHFAFIFFFPNLL